MANARMEGDKDHGSSFGQGTSFNLIVLAIWRRKEKAMRHNGSNSSGKSAPCTEPPSARGERDTGPMLDEQLNSAATPFLYLLSSIIIAAAGYFLYAFLHG
jgi:hypothetical protein